MNANKCSICCSNDWHLENIYEENCKNLDASASIMEVLNSLMCLRIFRNNSTETTAAKPFLLCVICRNASLEAYKFKKQLERATENLQKTAAIGTQSDYCSCYKCKDLRKTKTCTICNKIFSRAEHLRRHVRNIHAEGDESRNKTLEKAASDLVGAANSMTDADDSKYSEQNESWLNNNTTVNLLEPEIMLTTSINESDFQNFSNDDYAIADSPDMDTNPLPSDDEFLTNDSNGKELPSFFNTVVPSESIDNNEMKKNIKVENNALQLNDMDHANAANGEMAAAAATYLLKAADIKQEKDISLDENNTEQQTSKTLKRKSNVKNAAAEIGQTLTCQECQHTFTRRCHLRRHMLSHLNEKPHPCTFCEKRFTRKDHLKNHIASLHSTKDIKCEYCDAVFARKDHLERHMECKHNSNPNANKKFDCEYCQKKFVSKSYLQKHILMHTERVYACKYCDATFKERKHMREHEKIHNASTRNYLCSLCGESFLRNDYLIIHMRRHNGEKPYKCQYCGKGFPRSTDLKMHERYHTGTKPNKCNLCGKAFHRAYNLTIHLRTHTGERPYQCEQCSKSFAQSNDLKAHIRRHTGERYKCIECNASFLQLYSMRQHAWNAHGVKIDSVISRLKKFTSTAEQSVADATIEKANDVKIESVNNCLQNFISTAESNSADVTIVNA